MSRLIKHEAERIKALRAENLRLVGKSPVRTEPKVTVATIPAPSQGLLSVMAARCFTANLNASDLRYMALALLQMQDTICELKERVRALESETPTV